MQNVIVTECNKCVRCFACVVACKIENEPPLGTRWTEILRIGPNPINDGDEFPNTEMYYLPMKCQHCYEPECVEVCPTGASQKTEDGTVQIDKEKCIGCQFCVMACPAGVRHLNNETKVGEKCTMCEQLISAGELPECVASCTGQALHFGDIEDETSDVYKLVQEAGDNAYHLPDVGNSPANIYILKKMKWRF
ncbi:MAG: 4Fe-4S dicluster domain-containing protein [Eggerthellaceae bacterium]|nr:4Fe-4S dicluster domain-containing protein [Eggerthellaceae bacterium]